VLNAFTSLRHQSNVSDLLDFTKLRFVRRLGAGVRCRTAPRPSAPPGALCVA
jgi:hypothetical protein